MSHPQAPDGGLSQLHIAKFAPIQAQGMGRWVPAGDAHDWPLHLAHSFVDGPDDTLWSGLSRTVGDLANVPGAEPMAEALTTAQDAIAATVAAFPDFARVADNAAVA